MNSGGILNYSTKRKAHLKLGRRGENLSAELLKSKGMSILVRNYRTSYGELDIVCRDGSSIVFTEVKTLRRIGRYRPIDNYKKRQVSRNIRAAHEYIRQIGAMHLTVRFDFIEVILPVFGFMKIHHYMNFIHDVKDRKRL